jgi:hypothetical protein
MTVFIIYPNETEESDYSDSNSGLQVGLRRESIETVD